MTKFINKLETKAKKLVNLDLRANMLSDEEIAQKVNLNVPDQFKKQYLQLLQKHRKRVSVSKTNLGQCKTYKHGLHLKDNH